MKQKDDSSQVITKTYLKAYVDEKFALNDVKTDLKLENLERKIDEKAREYRDQILTSNDKLAKTLETMREELEINNFQMRDKIENHEKRIEVLESS